jgi:hypothetical protein
MVAAKQRRFCQALRFAPLERTSAWDELLSAMGH